MLGIRNSAKEVPLLLAACLAFLVSQNSLKGSSYSGNTFIVAATGKDSNSQGIEGYLKALESADSYERHSAIIALGKTANPAAVDPLIKALNDPDSFARSFAAIALGNLKDPRALNPLIRALGDTNERVRRSAVEALGMLQTADSLFPLTQALKDEDVFVRRSAAQALGTLGSPKAVDSLIEALGDADDYVWNGASNALTDIGEAGVPKLVAALGNWLLGPRAAKILNDLRWQPSSDEEKIRFEVASRKRAALLQHPETARKVLLPDIGKGTPAQAENAIYALIGIGREEDVEELAKALRSRGSLELARAFLQSGHDRLAELARAWAVENGKQIPNPAENPVIKWGGL